VAADSSLTHCVPCGCGCWVTAGSVVPESGYKLTEKSLTLLSPPAGPFELEVTTAIKPQDNSLLEGLYKSGGNYSTQVNLGSNSC
jgi:aminopeptidase N